MPIYPAAIQYVSAESGMCIRVRQTGLINCISEMECFQRLAGQEARRFKSRIHWFLARVESTLHQFVVLQVRLPGEFRLISLSLVHVPLKPF